MLLPDFDRFLCHGAHTETSSSVCINMAHYFTTWNERGFTWASCCVPLKTVKVDYPSRLKCVWQKRPRALHSDGWPPQHRRPHTSLQPASCGLTLQPRLLAPNPLSKSSANFCGFRTAVLQTLTLRLPFLTRRRPPAFLAASHGPRAQLGLRDPSTSAVPTFQPGGRFVGGISCELSCQRGTITAAHQSLAVTVGHRASGVEVPLWTECSLGGHACIFFFTELIKDVKLDEQREQKGGILPWEVPPPPLQCFPFLSKVTFSYQSDCLKMCRSSTTQDSH